MVLNVKRDSYKRLVAAAKKAVQTRSVEAIEHGTAIESTQEAAKGELALENARKTFKKAIVGASSVITKNVKNGSLALTRTNQTEVKNYKRKK